MNTKSFTTVECTQKQFLNIIKESQALNGHNDHAMILLTIQNGVAEISHPQDPAQSELKETKTNTLRHE